MEFPRPKRAGSRRFRIVNVVDDVMRECLAAVADTSLSGRRAVRELTAPIRRRGRDKNDPKDPQVILHMLGIGLVQRYYDPLIAGINDVQELQQQAARRVPERGGLRQPDRGPGRHQKLAARL
jgi:hypothetical protein